MNGSKLVVSVAVVVAVAGSAAVAFGQGAAGQGVAVQTVASHGLPASLDALYPPQTARPEFLMGMVDLGGRMAGVVVDFATGDTEHLAASFAAFEAAYAQTAGLVPEWRERFPVEPMRSLGEAIASGDPAQVGPALQAMGGVCASCHHDTMAAVAFRYHWPDAGTITTTDPVTGRKVGHAEFMHQLDFSMTGITHDLAQGQVDSARAHFQDFRKRFVALGETCENCHGVEERHYFTDAASASRVDAIGAALSVEAPDPAAVQGAVMEVGFNTCHRCHLVHVPAAFSKLAAAH